MASTQHLIGRVRPPRVQITYDVEIGNAIEMKELPFVMGIIADLSGQPLVELPKIKQRKFVEIDRDNFSEIMSSIKPHLRLTVDNKLKNDGSQVVADLIFQEIDDFTPLNLIKQSQELSDLFQSRNLLKDLLTKLDGNDVLEELLRQVMNDQGKLNQLKDELGAQAPEASDA
jgi:type VI secretion system protein ImpB